MTLMERNLIFDGKYTPDGAIYYISLLDTIYLTVSDKKGIKSLYDPTTNHRHSMMHGKRVAIGPQAFLLSRTLGYLKC